MEYRTAVARLTAPISGLMSGLSGLSAGLYIASQQNDGLVGKIGEAVQNGTFETNVVIPTAMAVIAGYVAKKANDVLDADAIERGSMWGDAKEKTPLSEAYPNPVASAGMSAFNGVLRSFSSTTAPVTRRVFGRAAIAKANKGLEEECRGNRPSYLAGQALGYAAQAAIGLEILSRLY